MKPRRANIPKDHEITALEAESMVIITGSQESLPLSLTTRHLGKTLTYRPLIEVRDNTDRLYSKNSLPLFETAVFAEPSEPYFQDTSDAAYLRLHRKPEYIEKRVRNRELELYRYSRFREASKPEATQPDEQPEQVQIEEQAVKESLSESERRRARCAGCILEQFLVLAAEVPQEGEFMLPPRLYGQMIRQRGLDQPDATE
ncbi:hypothetical protein BX070DRAFT_217993 [Coemansia spiralis]|nr:hypothetical protein BX070DRAFT_217993 [Coemansia spiralis]